MPEQMTKQDAIETLEIFRNDYTREGSAMCRAIDIALDALRQPTIEPEVRHGWWTDNGEDKFICSACKGYVYRWFGKRDFCPNCGARMDGGADNG